MTAALTHQRHDDCPVSTHRADMALSFAHMLTSAVSDDWCLYDGLQSCHGSIKSHYTMLKKTMLRCTGGQPLSVVTISE